MSKYNNSGEISFFFYLLQFSLHIIGLSLAKLFLSKGVKTQKPLSSKNSMLNENHFTSTQNVSVI